MTTESASAPQRRAAPYVGLTVTFVCVAVVGVGLAWAFLAMRAVMGVGGSCASGGPYEIATPCPDGAWLIAVAIPMMMIAMFVGSGFAAYLGGPTLILPMWGLLFTSLGWNFLEFGLTDGVEPGFLVSGIVFELMGLPAIVAIGYAAVRSLRRKPGEQERSTSVWGSKAFAGGVWWWLVYVALIAAGALLGAGTYTAIAT